MANRSRSRSPLERANRASPAPSNASTGSRKDMQRKLFPKPSIKDGEYFMKLENVPLDWKWHNVMEYIKKQTSYDKTTADDIAFIHLSKSPNRNYLEAVCVFRSAGARQQVFYKCKHATAKIDGKKLYVTIFDDASLILPPAHSKGYVPRNHNTGGQSIISHHPSGKHGRVNMNFHSDADNEMYGLSASYLTQLGITPPLKRWVFVKAVPEQYDEAKVRQVFGLAGTLVSVQLLEKNKNGIICARLEYDHPVEAVQAVSMFNNQEVVGGMLRCSMDNLPKDTKMSRGPGLGPDGTPLRGVRVAIEVKKLKSEIMTEIQRVHDSIDELKAQVTTLMQSNEQQNFSQVQTPAPTPTPTPIVANPLAAISTLLTNQLQPIQLLQNLMQPNTGTDLNALTNALQTLTNNQATLPSAIPNIQTAAIQPVPNMQGGPNIQGGPNLHGGTNIQGGPGMNKNGPNNAPGQFNNVPGPNIMQRGSNMQPGPFNMQGGSGGPNMHRGSNNMQGGPNNMQGGPNNMQGGHNNMQGGPNNMQGGPNSMQGGPNDMQRGSNDIQRGSNMHGGPNNMQGGPNNMQGGPNNMQGGPNDMQRGSNMHGGPKNMQGGPNDMQRGSNMHGGPGNMHQGNQHSFNQGSNTGPNGPGNNQSGYSNMQSGYSNILPGNNQQINSGFGLQPQFINNSNRQQEQQTTSMLLFLNLPPSVNLQMLQTKMSEVGNVKAVDIPNPGRALVSFFSENDTDKCIRLFNQSKVDGQMIEVRKV